MTDQTRRSARNIATTWERAYYDSRINPAVRSPHHASPYASRIVAGLICILMVSIGVLLIERATPKDAGHTPITAEMIG